MTRAIRWGLALLGAFSLLLLVARPARAQAEGGKPMAVYVLSITTDDADDQAEALTQALRSRVRQLRAWSLQETTQSFETLASALKCPSKPDANCLQRIADQLHVDRFIWGTMSKKPGGQVLADVHMWSRGRGDLVASDTYSDNLKDASDESLRTIAFKLFNTISGTNVSRTAVVVVHAGGARGDVLVDGEVKGSLDRGLARIEVPTGSHKIGVSVDGVAAPEQAVSLSAGEERELTFVPTAPAGAAGGESSSGGISARRVIAYAALGVGGALVIAGVVEAAQWVSDNNANNSDRQRVKSSIQDVCANEINSAAEDACRKEQDAVTASTLGWVFGGIGAVLIGSGTVLLLTDHSSSSEGAAATPTTGLPAEAERQRRPRARPQGRLARAPAHVLASAPAPETCPAAAGRCNPGGQMHRRAFLAALTSAALAPKLCRAEGGGRLKSIARDDRGTTLVLGLPHAPFAGTGYGDDTVLAFVPAHYRYRPGEGIASLVHFHGHNTSAERAMTAHELREQLSESKQNAILIVPQLAVFAADSSCGRLEGAGALAQLVGDALVATAVEGRVTLGDSAFPADAQAGTVCLSAHSGGYHAAACGLDRGGLDVRETYLFDALYADVAAFARWVVARRGRPARERHKLVSYFTEGGATEANSRTLRADLERSGVLVAQEMREGDLSRHDLSHAEAVFVRSGLWHSAVTWESNALRDVLFASALPRHPAERRGFQRRGRARGRSSADADRHAPPKTASHSR